VERVRAQIADSSAPDDPGDPQLYARLAQESLVAEDLPSLRPVINATGVVLHTNLGRAPLPEAALRAMARVGPGYTNLEFDLDGGRRGSRYVHCTSLIRDLTGAQDALVVNNCAAALVLVVNSLAAGARVAVSRGELVEIGGGFRIPEILSRAGAVLVEVGSTNRTRLADYKAAAEADPLAVILKVHRSNFRMTGFTEDTDLAELATLATESGATLVHDLGSGLLVDPARLGLPDEPRPHTSLAQGAEVTVFSGDKLLGGPQAGLIAGSETVISTMRANPLCRALRVDKATLAGLEATLRLYRDPDTVLDNVPTLRMLATPAEALEVRANALADLAVKAGLQVTPAPGHAAVGGGTFPGVQVPSWTLRVQPSGDLSVDTLAQRLRTGDPPVVGRREDGALVLDLRTVAVSQEESLLARLKEALGSGP
jgi:L-seryl-tRNA(Ser) seleniumtransferase